jgi:hypothetical protein
MHLVILIIYLKPTPLGKDLFKRPLLEQPDLVYVNSNNKFNKSYEIKQIL